MFTVNLNWLKTVSRQKFKCVKNVENNMVNKQFVVFRKQLNIILSHTCFSGAHIPVLNHFKFTQPDGKILEFLH